MSTLAFVTHPSVRIKGTENAFTPTQCLDERCPVKAPHFHCPFCVKSDAYQDPVILKAHYRVKHVDKGIEFAGLKILRCCDQCDIIGIIKGEKRFKGAHWHCYRCRNGFNRRDEAIKHYKTHFRNPQTTFQIQITQDLNSPPEIRAQEDHSSAIQEPFGSVQNPMQAIIRPSMPQHTISDLSTNVIKTVDSTTNPTIPVQKVKNDPLDKTDDTGGHEDEETIMIIQGSQLETALASHIIDSGDLGELGKASVDTNLSWEIRCRMEEEEKNLYKAKAEDYKNQVDLLKQQVSDLESQLSQQRQLCFHELLELLASDDHAQKVAASEQVAKFLEQCQTFLPQGCLSQLKGSSEDSLLLQAHHHHQQHQQHDGGSVAQQHQQHHHQSHESHKPDNIAGLIHGFETGEEEEEEEATEQAEELQVIDTTQAGKVVLAGSFETVTKLEEDAGFVGDDHHGTITVQTQDLAQPEQTTMFVQMLGQPDHQQQHHQQQQQEQEMQVSGVLPEMTPDPAGVVDGLEASAGTPGGLLGTGCIMKVVPTPNGLASLATDVSVNSAVATDAADQTFMMTLEDGQRLILQSRPDTSLQQTPTCDSRPSQSHDEPDKKRLKVS